MEKMEDKATTGLSGDEGLQFYLPAARVPSHQHRLFVTACHLVALLVYTRRQLILRIQEFMEWLAAVDASPNGIIER